ncbi:pimeloyl-ACP methyl ester esterase BioH [Shewanella sp. WXL01]|uniref:pimeloyl-ACP methyl ester esterase BioH n=1 Tax=Shewanella sp. WXL01 TaxID=2709721 RepID=UPI001438266B|nr:pimeloyl-ACP methyl ester esterase BioH [Shewanella sp. WXL01]NKF52126.1 pimeloyl-ACP methyl ester esterase BioH [Shewanella sp. WXL01]
MPTQSQQHSALTPQLAIESIGSGKDVILLHGWGVNSAVFNRLAKALTQLNYRVHLVDLPGFGDSQFEGQEFNQQSFAAWAQTLVNQLPQDAIWVGWSLGGLLASHIAINHPDSVSALVTVASSPCFMAREQQDERSWPGIQTKVLKQFSHSLQQDLAKTVEQFLAIQAMGSPHAKADIKQLKQLVLAKPLPNPQALSIGLTFLAEVDLRAQLERIDQPWLRLWGKLDGLVPFKMVPMLTTRPNIKDISFAKASHAPFISHAEEFESELANWLQTQT